MSVFTSALQTSHFSGHSASNVSMQVEELASYEDSLVHRDVTGIGIVHFEFQASRGSHGTAPPEACNSCALATIQIFRVRLNKEMEKEQ